MDHKEEPWFNYKMLGMDGFTDFHGLMAAILAFRTFVSQISIDFLLVIHYSQ